MRNFSLAVIISACLAFTSFGRGSSDTCILRIEYLGENSKPFPILIFYTGYSVDTTISRDTTVEDIFGHKIRVSEDEFSDIAQSIKKINFSPQFPQLIDSLGVLIHRNDQIEIIKTSSVSQINQIFDSVRVRLKGHQDNREIERYINHFKKRLGIAILYHKMNENNMAFIQDRLFG